MTFASRRRAVTCHLLLRVLAFITFSAALQAQTVRFHTTLGDIDVNLAPDAAPQTVANFMNYVNRGAYTNSIFHRVVAGFIVQGGGYIIQNRLPALIPNDAPVVNEFKISNTRGTVAMAKLGSSPDSATDQWFFNLADNSANLDSQNGGFTVFGRVANDASLAVMDNLGAIKTYAFNGGANANFADSFPLLNYTSGLIKETNYVYVTSIATLTPADSAAGFTSAASFAASSTAGISPGEMITIFGKDFGPSDLTGLQLDSNGAVTNSLAGTRVLFDGTPGTMIYSLSTQLSVIAPYNLAGKTTVNVVVEYQGIQTAPVQFRVALANPGIFTRDSSGKGDGAIVHPDGSPVSTASPAQVGDTLLLYGEGYGATSPALPDGAVVGTTLPKPVGTAILLIDGKAVTPQYAGGAPNYVNGVLQLNFVVPQLAPGAHQVQVQVGSAVSPAGVNLQTR
jgi:peptidyl-prolyl cis-trans isomerase A (cyclophilin A)